MTEQHLNSRDLELYVMHGLGADLARRVEEHAATCERCAQALAREARLELQLHEVGDYVASKPRQALISRRGRMVLAAALVAAAALVLVVVSNRPPALPHRGTGRGESSAAPVLPVCVQQPRRCISPHQHGLVAVPNPGSCDIPRYEELVPRPMAANPPLAGMRRSP